MLLIHLAIIPYKTDGAKLELLRNFCVKLHPEIEKESKRLFNSNSLWEKYSKQQDQPLLDREEPELIN